MRNNYRYKEVFFQLIMHLIVFVFYAFDRNQEGVEAYRYAYFINYALTAAIINYICVPVFYKKNNLLLFIGMVSVLILSAAYIEEFVLEQIYFSGKRAQNVRIVWALLDIIPVVAMLSGVKFGWDALVKDKEVHRLEGVVKDSELQFLKSQINPHFLFNNLNNLYAYALEGSNKTPEIILELSGLLRYMLYECQEQYVSLKKEIDHLRNFINLNELQIEDRGRVKFLVDDINASYTIAPLIMVVFVENAFKHSQSSQSEGIEIEVTIELQADGQLHFRCSNSYQELSNNDSLSHGIGLENVKKRLELIYPNAHTLSIRNTDLRYEVDLTIDLTKSNI